MKHLLLILVAAIFIPAAGFSQKALSEKDIEKIALLSEEGRNAEALRIIDALKQNASPTDRNYALLVMLSAEINMKEYNIDAAIKDNEEILKLVPEVKKDCLNQIGRLKTFKGDFDGAAEAYGQVIKLQPDDELVYGNLAFTYNMAGKHNKAIETLNLNTKQERRPFEKFQYALAYYKTGQMDSAKTYIDSYLKTDQGEYDHSANKYAALIYSELKQPEVSCAYITKANEIIKMTKADADMPEKMQKYHLAKTIQQEVSETKSLRAGLCK